MNSVNLVGNVVRDPEIKYAKNDMCIAKFSIAVRKAFKKEGGPDVDFLNVTAFGKTAELIESYVSKGSKVGVEGRIENNNYEKDGKKVYHDQIYCDHIEFLSKAHESAPAEAGTPAEGFTDSDSEVLPF
jgi:single-strand DNA-binding protein